MERNFQISLLGIATNARRCNRRARRQNLGHGLSTRFGVLFGQVDRRKNGRTKRSAWSLLCIRSAERQVTAAGLAVVSSDDGWRGFPAEDRRYPRGLIHLPNNRQRTTEPTFATRGRLAAGMHGDIAAVPWSARSMLLGQPCTTNNSCLPSEVVQRPLRQVTFPPEARRRRGSRAGGRSRNVSAGQVRLAD